MLQITLLKCAINLEQVVGWNGENPPIVDEKLVSCYVEGKYSAIHAMI